jgi:hypothetical protein
MNHNYLTIDNWTGNNIISLLHALFISVSNNYNLSFPEHFIFNTTSIILNQSNIKEDIQNHCDSKNFYYKPELKNIDNNIFNNNQIQKKVYNIIKSIGTINIPYKKNNDLVIHIRSGDIFRDKECYNSIYLFPPFYYYDNIITNNKFDNIYIIAEDDKNPIINKLCIKYPNIKFKLDSIQNDIELLLSVSNVVFSVGTFLNILIFSKNIKTVYFPQYDKKDLNINNNIFDTETAYLYHNDIYCIQILNIPIIYIY